MVFFRVRLFIDSYPFFMHPMYGIYSIYGHFTLVCIGAPNFPTDSLNGSVRKKLGKYSFGIYLFHPLCIYLVRYQLAITRRKQEKTIKYVGTILDIEVFGLVFIYSYL